LTLIAEKSPPNAPQAIKANKKVEVHVKIEYVENSARPKTFRVNYIIDGQTFTRQKILME